MKPEHDTHSALARLETCFRDIERVRMSGVPIMNPALAVKAVGCERWNGEWVTVLVTPWFMNLMLLPINAAEDEQAAYRVGAKDLVDLPGGRFEVIRGFEESLGFYRMCSLFSPVLEFADQATAEETAKAAFDALLKEDDEPQEVDRDMQAIWRGERPQPSSSPPPAAATNGTEAGEAKTEGELRQSEPREKPALSRRALFLGHVRSGEAP